MDLRLPGPLDVPGDEHPLAPGGVKQRLVLAILRHDPELDALARERRITTARPPPERSLPVVPASLTPVAP